MQQFIVPQFIDVEDKVIGPITTRQFIILLAGALIIGLGYKLFDFSLFIVFGLFMFGATGIVAFLKINGRPFHYFVLNLFQTFKKTKLRIWRHIYVPADSVIDASVNRAAVRPIMEKRHTSSRLAELSLIVDTKGAYQGERGNSEVQVERKF